MGFIRRQLLKVIKWDDSKKNLIVYRYPMEDRDEIMNGCQLIVSESQVAMLVSGGQIADVYGPGTHKLTTNNMPILTKLASWKYGFDSPFKADVYYVNTKQFINLKWGTASKVPMRDADFGVIRIGGRGQYSFKVSDAPTFMREIFGTNRDYSTDALTDYFRSLIVTSFTNAIGLAKIPALDLAVKYMDIADTMKSVIQPEFDKLGIEIVTLTVENISVPEEVEKAMDERASVGVMSDSLDDYTQYQTAQAIKDAANNPGGGASAGVGIGIGVGLGQAVGNAMVGNNQNNNQQQPQQNTPTQQGPACPKCSAPTPAGAKFCPNCGNALPTVSYCPNCGTQVAPGSKFCSNCGQKL